MNTRKGVVAVALGVSLAAAPLGAAQAEDERSLSADQGQLSAIVTKPTGAQGPKLKFTGRTPKDPAAERNNERYAGAAPSWVQRPVVQKKKGKTSLLASASVRAFKRKGEHAKSASDKVTLKVSVFPRGASSNDADATYIKRVSVKVSKHGLVSVRVPLSKNAAKHVKTLKQQRDRIVVNFIHAKDTYPSFGLKDDFQQVLAGAVTDKVISKKRVKKQIASNVRASRKIEAGKPRPTPGARVSDLNQFYYYTLYVFNNTPFQQSVSFNPNIACMETATGTAGSIIANNVTVSPMIGTVQLLANPGPNSPYSNGGIYDQWYGSTLGNPPASETVSGAQSGLVQGGRNVLNALGDNIWDPEFYTESGLLTGALAAGLTLGISALVNYLDSQSTCNNYGQYWGITSTALMVGVPGNTEIVGNPDTWAVGYSQTPGDITQANGQPVMRYVSVGESSLMANNLPTDTADQQALAAIMNSAVGMQAQSTYFMNAGMPAPIANADGNQDWNGTANFSQGLIQYPYPNPGSCPNNNCNTAQTGVQLNFLVENFDQIVGPLLYDNPTATVTTGVNANTGETDTIVNCSVPSNGEYNNPFGGTQGSPAPATDPELTSLQGMQGVTNAGFNVSYYAQDAAGNFLYSNETTSTSNFPGTITSPPALNASSGGTQLLSMNQASAVAPTLYLSANDIANLIDPTTGNAATPVSYGCAVTPVVSWSNMNVTSGSVWGANWPFPQVQENGPLSSPLANQVNWANPVNAINLTWTGDLYVSTPVPAP